MRETNAAAFNTRPLYCWRMVLLPCWTRVCRRLAGNHSVCSWALFQGFENGLLKSMGKLTAKHNCVSMLGFSLFFRLPCNHLQALGHSCAHNSTVTHHHTSCLPSVTPVFICQAHTVYIQGCEISLCVHYFELFANNLFYHCRGAVTSQPF